MQVSREVDLLDAYTLLYSEAISKSVSISSFVGSGQMGTMLISGQLSPIFEIISSLSIPDYFLLY